MAAQHQPSHTPAYGRLALMAILSFAAMYALMYAMVASAPDIHANLNQAYMAGLMTAPMIIIELVLMGRMYPRRMWNGAILVGSLVFGLACFGAIRSQALIGDSEFLRSMIPHHSGAILMCRQAQIRDPQIRSLCATIIAGQRHEIEQMNAMLARGR
jgi:uncharacterized protein (DUF305 family)